MSAEPIRESAARERVVVAMSGGVDSSVAAALLVEAGCEAIGITLHLAGAASRCCSLDDADDARAVAERLGIRFFVANYRERFRSEVQEAFADDYLAGRTPIPCVACNSRFKFAYLLERAGVLGAAAVASGHYARADTDPATGLRRLRRAADAEKDQTYFLWGIAREVLEILELPLGDLTKPEVRRRARELELRTADKPESFDICFVPDGDYGKFLATRLDENHPAFQPGPIVTLEGAEIGTHDGYSHFTIGQRKRLPGGFKQPMYVVEIEPATRSVVIGSAAALNCKSVAVGELNWLCDPPKPGDELSVQIRHRGAEAGGRVVEIGPERLQVRLHGAHRAVAPGQSAAIYGGDQLLGGGTILKEGSSLTAA